MNNQIIILFGKFHFDELVYDMQGNDFNLLIINHKNNKVNRSSPGDTCKVVYYRLII